MSNWDDRSGWRPDLQCPACGKNEIWYTGDVDVTLLGDTGRSRVSGAYVCKDPGCRKFEQQVEPERR
jgi:hypothetical protein